MTSPPRLSASDVNEAGLCLTPLLSAFVRAVVLVAMLTGAGCSVKRYAINYFANTLASGGSVFESDDDLILIGEALPFSIKLLESLSAEVPDNRNLLLATSRSYLLYSYAFVHFPAERATLVDIDRARALRARSRGLYLRSFDFALRALEVTHPGIENRLREDPEAAVLAFDEDDDVATMYWTAAALGLAIATSKNEPALLARIPEVQALVSRALTVDETWNAGALHEFAINLSATTRHPHEPRAAGATFPARSGAVQRHACKPVCHVRGSGSGSVSEPRALHRSDTGGIGGRR